MLSPKIETERLVLRRYKETDIDAVYDIITDKRLSTFIKYPDLTKEQELECIKKWIKEADESVMNGDSVDITKVSAISFDPYTHGYYKVEERVGIAFKDGLELK